MSETHRRTESTAGFLAIPSTNNSFDTLEDETSSRRRSVVRDNWLIRTTIALLLVAIMLQLSIIFDFSSSASQETCTTFGPASSTHTLFFANDTRYMNTWHSSDELWESLVPENKGINPKTERGISMFHQLHCLMGFRHAIQQMQDGRAIGHSPEDDTSMHRGHWPHCFDYLKQTILCHADDTPEPLDRLDGGISGLRAERTCRDSAKLYELAWTYEPMYAEVETNF